MRLLSLLEMRTKLSYLVALLAISSALIGCLKVENFPDEPTISFDELVIRGDSATINFSFTDGDGNFGLTEEDSNIPPFDEGIYQNNLFLSYFELDANGVWQEFSSNLPVTSPYYIPLGFNSSVEWLQPEGTNKTQQGTVSYNLGQAYFNPASALDSCRFSFYIVDRDLNESNVELTNSFKKPS